MPRVLRVDAPIPRYVSAIERDAFLGQAELWDQETLVRTVPIDKDFIFDEGTRIVSYEAPDGTAAELHVWSCQNCATPPDATLRREEVEALEDAP